MASKGLVVRLQVDGMREALAAFRKLPKDANDELRTASLALAQALAGSVADAARTEGRQAALLATTVKASRDRVPAVQAGGTKRLGRKRKPAYKLLFGSEFGSSRLRQYRPHRGREGYWFFPVVEREQDEILAAWNRAAQAIADKFGAA